MKNPPAPTFDETTAKPVPPRRHRDGRTISFEQPGEGCTHLFSATGLFIATQPVAAAASKPTPGAQ